jgi:hypothetical protein
LAEVPIAEPELDIIAADAEHIAVLETQQEETKAALDTLVEKYDELATEKDNLANTAEFLQRQLDQRQIDLVQYQTENATLAQAVIEIEDQLLQAEEELARLRESMIDVPVAEETPAPAEIAEQDMHVYDDERLVSRFDKETLADLERPGDYLTPPETPVAKPRDPVIKGMYRTIPTELRRGVQGNFDLLKASRNATPTPDYQDNIPESGKAGFGVRYPEVAGKGDMFLRVDMMPNRAYKYNGSKWIEVDKDKTDRFAFDEAYIKHLHEGLNSGEYDLDDLNDIERAQLDQFRNNTTL